MSGPVAVLHLDESCLGNGREGENPGGGGDWLQEVCLVRFLCIFVCLSVCANFLTDHLYAMKMESIVYLGEKIRLLLEFFDLDEPFFLKTENTVPRNNNQILTICDYCNFHS